MKKLTNRKIEWIIRWDKRGKTNRELAESQKISKRRVQQLKAGYRRTGKIPKLSCPGRKRKPIELNHIKLILEEHGERVIERCSLRR